MISFRRQVGQGILWVAIATLATNLLTWVVTVILGRLLGPAAFGLVGYATLTINTLYLFRELGFSAALIYREGDTQEAAETTFWVSLGISLILFGVAFCGAPWIAGFFNASAELIPVLRALSLTLVIWAIGQVPYVLLARELDFRRRAIPDMLAAAGGGIVSLLLAFNNYGVWSLVWGRLTDAVLTTLLVWFFIPWRPRLRFHWRVAREMFNYGKHIIGSQILIFGITNSDNAFVGKFIGDSALGLYSQAYNLANLPATQITRLVGQVMFPAFSRIRHEPGALHYRVLQAMRYVSLLSVPLAVATIVFAPAFILTLYGWHWREAVLPLQLLSIYGLIRSVAAVLGDAFKAGGRPQWLTAIALWRLTTMLVFLYPAIQWRGIVGVAALSAVVSVVDFVISVALANRILQAHWREYVRILLPTLVWSVITAGLAYGVYSGLTLLLEPGGWSRLMALIVAGGIMALLYGAVNLATDADLRRLLGDGYHWLRTRRVRVA